MARRVYIFLLLLVMCLSIHSYGQEHVLSFRTTSGESLPTPVKFKAEHKKASGVKTEIRKVHNQLLGLGYLAVSVDSVVSDSTYHIAYVHVGESWSWARLGKGNADEGVLSAIGFREKIYSKKPLRPKVVQQLMEKMLGWCENHGYPFAEVGLDSITFHESTVDAVINLQKNQLVKIDSIHLKGNARIHTKYVANYLGIKVGDPWNEAKFNAIRNRIREIPFLDEMKPAEVVFTKDRAVLYLYLKDKKANLLNGIVGLLPDDAGRIRVTGELRIRLRNAFGRGESLDFDWRKLQSLTQNLDIKGDYPYLFNSPFGISANLRLYQKDSTFQQIAQHFGVNYLMKGNDYLQAYVERETSNLVDQDVILQYNTLPPFADVNTTAYGLAIQSSNLDYFLNPTKGLLIEADGKVGFKNIRKNDSLDILRPGIYDGVTFRSTQYNLQLHTNYFIPLGKRNTIKLGFRGGYMLNENLFQNEMFRIGGIHSLRGFDELSISASTFGIATAEYRFLLDQNSNIYVFYDRAYYEQAEAETFFADRPYGFGAGIAFETRAGIFSVNYALGSQQNNPILFRSAKIHFGFVNFL